MLQEATRRRRRHRLRQLAAARRRRRRTRPLSRRQNERLLEPVMMTAIKAQRRDRQAAGGQFSIGARSQPVTFGGHACPFLCPMPCFLPIPKLVDGCKDLFTSLSFFWFLKGRCHGNQLKSENRHFSRINLICRTAVPKRIAILQFRCQNIK